MKVAEHSRPLRWLAFFGALALWTLLVCYPNPAVFVRNFLRYRHMPIDPGIGERMGWPLPKQPCSIESFVDGLIAPTSDWRLYRVPWYMPSATEVVASLRGDCESKAVLLASLLAERGIPYQMRASFNHIWVDYPGRQPRPGETRDLAYLEGPPGRFGIHWPRHVNWRELAAVQKEQLWDAMPQARKWLWLLGLAWLALLAVTRPVASQAEGQYMSDWRVPAWDCFGRTAWLSAITLGLLATAPWSRNPARWSVPDLLESVAVSVATGALLTWLSLLRPRRSVRVEGDKLTVSSSLGWWRSQRQIDVSEVTHIQVNGSAGGLRPWEVLAGLPTGGTIALVRHRREVAARAAGRQLGLALDRPVVVRFDGSESRSAPDEIQRSLRERGARSPTGAALPRPRGCDLVIEEGPGSWVMRYPDTGRAWVVLLIMALFPVALSVALTYAILEMPWMTAFWAGWVIAVAFLGLSLYLALMLKGEIMARLAGVRVEIGGGELRFSTPKRRVERVALEQIESVELGRIAESPTVAVVTPDKVIHLREICALEHRAWVRQQVEEAILKAG